MNIGIIGSGNIGSTLAKHLVSQGHVVLIANSKGPSTLTKIASETGAKPATVEEAARAKDVVIIAVPETAVSDLPRAILSTTQAIVVDAGNYYPARDGLIVEIEEGLTDSEWVSKQIGHSVVKTFNNILAQSLASKGSPIGTQGRLAIAVAGDDQRERKIIMELVSEIGFDAVDAGTLAESWKIHPGTPSYCKDFDAASLKAALPKAEKSRLAQYRAEANEGARAYFTNPPK